MTRTLKLSIAWTLLVGLAPLAQAAGGPPTARVTLSSPDVVNARAAFDRHLELHGIATTSATQPELHSLLAHHRKFGDGHFVMVGKGDRKLTLRPSGNTGHLHVMSGVGAGAAATVADLKEFGIHDSASYTRLVRARLFEVARLEDSGTANDVERAQRHLERQVKDAEGIEQILTAYQSHSDLGRLARVKQSLVGGAWTISLAKKGDLELFLQSGENRVMVDTQVMLHGISPAPQPVKRPATLSDLRALGIHDRGDFDSMVAEGMLSIAPEDLP